MSGRAALASVAFVVLLVSLYVLRRDFQTPAALAPAPIAAPAAPAPEPTPPPPMIETVTAAAALPPTVSALDAEQVLRELEPLAVTDKPVALSRALAADERLSPHGVMAEARRALIVTLMVDTDRMPEARQRAREFIRLYPQSRYLPLVKGTTGIHPRPLPSERRDAR